MAQPVGQRLLDDSRGLESAGAQHGNAHGLLDAVRVGQVQPLDMAEVTAGLFPAPLEEAARETAFEEQVIAAGEQPARDERVVGLAQLLDREIAGGIARMRKEAAARDVNRVDAFCFEQAADLDGIFERVALRLAVEERVVVLDGADLHLQVKITADLGTDRANDLNHEARTILELAAVVVIAIVDSRAEELRDEIAVRPVQLDAVRAGLAGAARPLRKGFHDVLNLPDGHPLTLEPVQRIRVVGRAQALGVLDAGNVALAAAVTELQDVLAVALAVHLLDEAFPEGRAGVAIDRRVVGHDAAAHRDRHERRDDRTDPALGELDLPVDARLVARAVVVVEPSGDVRAKHAVLDRQAPELER